MFAGIWIDVFHRSASVSWLTDSQVNSTNGYFFRHLAGDIRMLNRLNRSVAFALCLGGAALIAVGCADTDDTTAASATATTSASAEKATDAGAEAKERLATEATVEADGEADEQSAAAQQRQEGAAEPAQLAQQLDALSPRRDTAGTEPVRTREQTERPQREGQASSDLLFSPSESFENITANLPDRDQGQRGDRPSEPWVEVTPSLLDLGTMGTSQTQTGTMTIRNISDMPVMIENSRTSCGCTVANVPRGQYLQPGESVDVEVSLRSSTRPQVLTKTVTFLIRDHSPIVARVRGEVVSYVTIEPAFVNADSFTEEPIIIRSADDRPFRITSVNPEITNEELSEEPATSHVFTIAWDRWLELGEARRLIFYTDHPEVRQVMATVRASRRPEVAAGRDAIQRPDREPAGPNPFALTLRGDTEQVLELLSEGQVDKDSRDRTGQTLLALAAQLGNVELVDALIEAGLEVDTTDSVGRTPLMNAGQAKHSAVVKRLVEAGAKLDVADSTIGGTALAWTVAFGDAESAKYIIDAGADVNIPTEATGYTPLIWAAGFGQADSVRHLIRAGAKLEETDRTEGATALMHATRTGRAANVKALIAAGANVEATDLSGKTPLLWAAGSSGADLETVKAIVEAGANLQVRDRAGLGALDHARGRHDANAQAVVAYLSSLIGEDDG